MTPYFRPLTILVVIPSFSGGGAERIAIQLCNYYLSLGHSVHLCIFKSSGPLRSELSPLVHVHTLNSRKAFLSIKPLSSLFNLIDPDVSISFMTHTNIAHILSSSISKASSKVIVSERNIPRILLTSRKKPIDYLYALLTYLLYPLADSIICVSPGVDIALRKILPLSSHYKSVVVPNPIDLIRIRELSRHPHNFKERLSGGLNLISIGRLTQQKNHSFLLNSFYHLLRILPSDQSPHLFIVGDGPLLTDLHEQARALSIHHHVTFTGFLPNPFSLLSDCDLLVLTSLWEGYPNVVLQALALEKRIATTNFKYDASSFQRYSSVNICDTTDPYVFAQSLALQMTSPIIPIDHKTFLAEHSPSRLFQSILNLE